MPPKEKTTNFKTWETQARLLAAVVASLGENFRFDYKSKFVVEVPVQALLFTATLSALPSSLVAPGSQPEFTWS
jgi:hypothetical protein